MSEIPTGVAKLDVALASNGPFLLEEVELLHSVPPDHVDLALWGQVVKLLDVRELLTKLFLQIHLLKISVIHMTLHIS